MSEKGVLLYQIGPGRAVCQRCGCRAFERYRTVVDWTQPRAFDAVLCKGCHDSDQERLSLRRALQGTE